MGRKRGRDPAWKKGPTHRKPTSDEHAISPEDFGHGEYDIDGFGVDEAKEVDGEELIVVMDASTCSRDGCDAMHTRRLLFTTDTLTDEEERCLRRHATCSTDESMAVHVRENVERVDAETIEVSGVAITAERVINNEPKRKCYGRIDPDPEPRY